jgi:hypothetical protein
MKVLTAVAAGLILNAFGAAAVSAQYYGSESSRRYYYGRTDSGRTDNWWRAQRIVREAYLNVLGREPDRSGLRQYTDAMVHRGWSEADVRRSLRSSDEYRERFGWRSGYTSYGRAGYMADGRATSIVRRAYLDVVGREPDSVGMREYTRRIVRDGWTERDVRRALRDTYRNTGY